MGILVNTSDLRESSISKGARQKEIRKCIGGKGGSESKQVPLEVCRKGKERKV